jgi:nondiscriminating aspartyl-tRNA synthetase
MTTEIAAHVGRRVRLAGWLHHARHLSRVSFLLVRDRDGIAQVVVTDDAQRAAAAELVAETVVLVEGLVAEVPEAPGGHELHDPTATVVSAVGEAPPFELRRRELKEPLPMILDHAAVALRHPRQRATFAVAAAALAGFRSTLDDLGFTEIATPKIVGAATESGANVFPIEYFGRRAYLAQSPQLYKQMMVGVFERVYETAPVFRAEPHDTVRHLNQYLSLDAELGFIEDHHDVMAVAAAVLRGMSAAVNERASGALEQATGDLPSIPAEVPKIDFVDAQRLIETDTGERVVGEPDLAPAHERWLGEWARREHGSDAVFVTGYPMAKRPFYTHPDPDRPGQSRSFDLLFRGLELVTGGQRLHRHEDYVAALAERQMDVAPLEGYLEAFRYGMPPHGGFAFGLERFVARLLDLPNVREATLFPRDMHRLHP